MASTDSDFSSSGSVIHVPASVTHSLDCNVLTYGRDEDIQQEHLLHRSEARTFSMDEQAISIASSRRESLSTQADSRRSSLTPESPYMVSDETRSRDSLLDSEESTLPIGINTHAPIHRPESPLAIKGMVTQVMGKATELISEVAEIIAGVVPTSDGLTADYEGGINFFVPSPEQEKDSEFVHQNVTERRNSLTPESPYQVSDETRARSDSITSDDIAKFPDNPLERIKE